MASAAPSRPGTGRRARPGPVATLVVVAAVLVVGVLASLAAAPAASAHALLVSSSPSDGERLPEPPTQVSLTFSEGVSVELGGVQVLDGDGQRVDLGTVTQPSDAQLLVGLEDDLPQGTYLISYRVVSADGHPVSGAVVFAVGDVLDEESVSGLAVADQPLSEALGVVGRALAYGGTLLAVGLAFFLLFLHDGGPDRRRLVGPARGAVLVAAVGTSLTVMAQASLATGLGIVEALDGDLLRSVLREGDLGWSVAVLLAGLALVYVAVGLRGAVAQGLAFYGGLCACGSFALYGHTTAASSRLAAGLADLVHVGVAAVWFGGLVGLAVTVDARRRAAAAGRRPTPALATVGAAVDRSDIEPSPVPAEPAGGPAAGTAGRVGAAGALDTAGIVLRFSTAAAVSVGILWLTGGYLALEFTGGIDGVLDDRYGQVLLVKLAVVAVVLGLAGWNRYRLIPQLLADEQDRLAEADGEALDERDADQEGDATALPATGTVDLPSPDDAPEEAARWARLVSTVRIEAALLVVVVLVTAVLVNVVPPAEGGLGAGPYNARIEVTEQVELDVTVAPAVTGRNTIHLTYLDVDTGRPVDAARELTVELALPSAGIAPIEEVPSKAGVGHWILVTEDLAIAGTWDVAFRTRLDQFTEVTSTVPVPVAQG